MFEFLVFWTWTCSYLISYWVPAISVTHSLGFESKRYSYATLCSHSLSCLRRCFPRWIVNLFTNFLVFIVHEGVTIRNLKTDSNSEFGCPNTAEECEQSVRGASEALRPSLCPCVSHVWHTARQPLCPRVAHAPHMWMVTWQPSIGLFIPSFEFF